eukprot:2189388-Prymnesium_polylepis.1
MKLTLLDANLLRERTTLPDVPVGVVAAVFLAERAEAAAAARAAAGEGHTAVEVDERLLAARAAEREDVLADVVLDGFARVVAARLLALHLEPLLKALLQLGVDPLLGNPLLGRRVLSEDVRRQRLCQRAVRKRRCLAPRVNAAHAVALAELLDRLGVDGTRHVPREALVAQKVPLHLGVARARLAGGGALALDALKRGVVVEAHEA